MPKQSNISRESAMMMNNKIDEIWTKLDNIETHLETIAQQHQQNNTALQSIATAISQLNLSSGGL